jgi:homoserine O-succinyltransferase/O-acetyltransferase
MPVCVDSKRSAVCSPKPSRGKASSRRQERSSPCISIGLINNMPQPAFTATERQFASLLDAASRGLNVRLSLYSLLNLPETPFRDNACCRYSSINDLWETNLDGLIVTGKEPVTANLRDESCWNSLTQLVEWARENTYSTVWSCLAAHAAVLYMDGISRHRNTEKHCGVFECVRVCGHRLMAGVPANFGVPHSRWNSLSEEELVSHGYSVLTRITGRGVDMFMKEDKSLFVFSQGHLEYDSDTLLREYRRDVNRYLNHEAPTYPSVPIGYFDRSTEITLTSLRDKATSCRSEELLAGVSTALKRSTTADTWSPITACIYGNWLQYINARKNGTQLNDANVA